MSTKFRFSVIKIALAALCVVADTEDPGEGGGGYVGTAATRAPAQSQLDAESTGQMQNGNFAPFCHWLNRHIQAGNLTVTYEGQSTKVDKILPDGKLRLRKDGQSYETAFEGTIIEELLAQIV